MSKIRIYELAKQLGVANKDLVAKINSIGIEAKSHMAVSYTHLTLPTTHQV